MFIFTPAYIRSRTASWLLWILLFIAHGANVAYAENYNDGYNKYVQGDFAGAESAFKSALGGTQTAFEKARILKMLGISQYMLGNRSEAESSFKQAKTLQPNVAIAPSEVLDESVLDFFNSVESPAQKEKPKKEAQQKPASKKESEASSSPTTPKESKADLMIEANVPNAKVVVDGQLLHKTGVHIRLNAGIHEVEVSAPKYKSVSQPLNLVEGKLTKVSVVLSPADNPSEAVPAETTNMAIEDKKEEPSEAEKKDALQTKGKKTKSKNRSNKKATKNSLVDWLPLGAGQYHHGKVWTGVAFTVGQLGASLFALSSWMSADKIVTQTNSSIDERTATQDTLPQSQQDAYFQETLSYRDSQDNKVNSLRTQSYVGMGIALSLWGASVVEALFNNNDGEKKPLRNKPQAPKAFLRIEKERLYAESYARSFEVTALPHQELRWSISPFVSTIDPTLGGLSLNLDVAF